MHLGDYDDDDCVADVLCEEQAKVGLEMLLPIQVIHTRSCSKGTSGFTTSYCNILYCTVVINIGTDQYRDMVHTSIAKKFIYLSLTCL